MSFFLSCIFAILVKLKVLLNSNFSMIQLASFFIYIFISSESSRSFCYCTKSLIVEVVVFIT
jgi:hypothetical protein